MSAVSESVAKIPGEIVKDVPISSSSLMEVTVKVPE